MNRTAVLSLSLQRRLLGLLDHAAGADKDLLQELDNYRDQLMCWFETPEKDIELSLGAFCDGPFRITFHPRGEEWVVSSASRAIVTSQRLLGVPQFCKLECSVRRLTIRWSARVEDKVSSPNSRRARRSAQPSGVTVKLVSSGGKTVSRPRRWPAKPNSTVRSSAGQQRQAAGQPILVRLEAAVTATLFQLHLVRYEDSSDLRLPRCGPATYRTCRGAAETLDPVFVCYSLGVYRLPGTSPAFVIPLEQGMRRTQ